MGFGLVLALAGCAGASSTTAGAITTSATSTSSPTTTAGGATVAQYASIIAKQRAGIGKHLDEMLSDNCDWTTPGSVDARPGYLTCGIGVLTVNFEAQSLQMALEGAQNIGAPPDEVTSIVADTKTAADTLASSSNTANPCTFPAVSPDSPQCVKALFDFHRAMTNMQAQFAAWGPYGV